MRSTLGLTPPHCWSIHTHPAACLPTAAASPCSLLCTFVLVGDAQHFVRRDELRAAWAIFTPLLHEIDAGKADPEPYPYGSRGPASQDKLLADAGYIRSTKYVWRPHPLDEDGGK